MSIQLSRVLSSASRSMGALTVRSIELGGERSSPVVVMDDFRVSGRPFGPHPHAGFSAMTYVFRDSPSRLRSRDSLGGHVVVAPGGVCWLEAGSGALHEEIPAETGAELHGLQVFVKLSRRNERTAPRTLSLPSEGVPVWSSPAGDDVRVAVGAYEGVASSLVPIEPFTLLDVALRREVRLPLAEAHNALVYVRRGDAVIEAGEHEVRLSGGQAVIASGGPATLRASTTSGADVMFLAGAAIRERVIARGPFMMSDASEIDAAIERYRSGRMGQLAPYADG